MSGPPQTPISKKPLSQLAVTSPGGCSPAVHLPPTPFLSRLGYGTGVSVFLYQRSPAGERSRSPWAVKKVNKRHVLSQFGSRLEEEARVLKSLSHPNIIGYRGYSRRQDGTHALLMEDGHQSLLDLLEERAEAGAGPLPAATVEAVLGWLAEALHYLHTDRRILHGDIKSGNVLVVGDFESVKLCDFGVTLPLNSEGRVSEPGRRYIGTEAWSPLEVVQGGEVTSKADIFALGLVLYEMLALHSPHVDKLCVDSDADSDADESVDETAFRAALGSRPLLPDTEQLDHTYRTVLEIFFAATDADPDKRPSAEEILARLKDEGQDQDDSVLCVNMVAAGDTTASAL